MYDILQKLFDDLAGSLGPDSSYDEDKIENFYLTTPDTLVGNTAICIDPRGKSAGDYEVGQNFSTTNRYTVEVNLHVKHSDTLDAIKLIDKLEKRMVKALMTSTILGTSITVDGFTETVLQFKLTDSDYTRDNATNLIRGFYIRLEIITEFRTT